jgi:hypothetical protein
MTSELRDDSCLCANERDIAAKVVDGEAILINLATGVYYSMDKVSGLVWSMIANRSSVERITGAIAARYPVPEAQVRADVQRLAVQLLAENLITATDGTLPPVSAEEPLTQGPPTYEAPTLTRFDDMAEMFALDPPLPELPAIAPRQS